MKYFEEYIKELNNKIIGGWLITQWNGI